ncbi:hypothetical protein PCYB_022380 [Plasmodium cynomolgi strain B]|uniref:RRM domain-containing protein n=1 Tax=Plasmodium cynomolgi (strain B) TaxID=1120755 RepID=K6UI45_PLACD|nr:hypothetical protein PCYB_022380 [Plasmodium cynomolgi strain B]GAB64668.1 hypothetical protein PCYB_022380 [Plasmodium cynomolgi strain B]
MEEEEAKEAQSIHSSPGGDNNVNHDHAANDQREDEPACAPNEGEPNKDYNPQEVKTNEGNNPHEGNDPNEPQNDEWLVYVSNQSYGPYNLDQMKKLWSEKRLNIMSIIFKKGEQNWKYVYNDDILKGCLPFNTPSGDGTRDGFLGGATAKEHSSVTTEPKIKIYYDENNQVKGDALVTYVYTQSVDIAIKYFDNFYIRQDCMIRVEKAQFNKKKEASKVSKEEMLIKKKKIKAAKYEQLRLQKWGDGYTGTKKKIVIFRNVFSYEDAVKHDEGDPFYDFIKDLVEMEVKKYAPVHKVYPIPKHPNGIVCVKFKGVEEAEMIVSCFKDMELNDKKLEVYFYDGKQDLKAQCLPAQSANKARAEDAPENEEPDKHIEDNQPSFLQNNNLQSFHDWIDNQSEDEEHEIMVE